MAAAPSSASEARQERAVFSTVHDLDLPAGPPRHSRQRVGVDVQLTERVASLPLELELELNLAHVSSILAHGQSEPVVRSPAGSEGSHVGGVGDDLTAGSDELVQRRRGIARVRLSVPGSPHPFMSMSTVSHSTRGRAEHASQPRVGESAAPQELHQFREDLDRAHVVSARLEREGVAPGAGSEIQHPALAPVEGAALERR